MAFVPCDQIVRTSRDGTFKDAMVVYIPHHAGEMQGRGMRVVIKRSSRTASRTCGSVQRNLSCRIRRNSRSIAGES